MKSLKHLELWFRRQFNRHVGAQRIPIVVGHPQQAIPIGTAPRILVLRQDRIGDVLVAVPVLRALRECYPASVIDMVLSPNNIAARSAVAPYIDDVIIHLKGLRGLLKTRRTLRVNSYDVVIDLMDNASSTSALLVSFAHSRYAVGIDKENRGVYTHVVPLADRATVHIVERISRLLWPLNVDPATHDLHLEYPLTDAERAEARRTVREPSSKKKIFGINISGSDVSRMYSEAGIIELIEHCKKHHPDTEAIVLCAKQHQEMQERIAQATGSKAIAPTPSFHSWAAIVSELDALFTPDTSSVHLAAAFQKPSVVLFVHDRIDLMPWYPYLTTCYPVETTSGTIDQIPIAEVIQAVDRCLGDL
ncbi:MAG: glycosyltransferase family 9 protein [Candidatus Kapabacteria bacterium]|nr:glycosyltransferase family 9 protein [Candidatus Kapabacteria bacterium]